MADKPGWEIKTGDDVANALDWLRRRMGGKAVLLVAIGQNSIAFSKDQQYTPEEAIEALEANIRTLQMGLNVLRAKQVTRDFKKRGDV